MCYNYIYFDITEKIFYFEYDLYVFLRFRAIMSLIFEKLEIRNFLSFGNVPQTIELNKKPYQLVVGLNKDKSESSAERNGTGKAQPLYSKVLTEEGWVNMGDLTTLMKVVTPKGQLAQILDIFYKGHKPIYRVFFKDGRYTDCCDEHLWKIWTGLKVGHKSWDWKVVETKEILQYLSEEHKGFKKNIYVPLVEDVFVEPDKNLFITPYIMGVMLGDGYMNCCRLTSCDEEIVNNVQQQLDSNYELTINKKNNAKVKDYTIVKKERGSGENLYKKQLKKYKLHDTHSWDKFIPDDYLNLSKKQTLELLQGLFDTDGYVDKNGNITYCTTSIQLAKNVQYLIWKLGGLCEIKTRNTKYKYNGEIRIGRVSYNLKIRIKDGFRLFSLSRKKNRCLTYQYNDTLKNRIEKIEYVGEIPCQCIYIDDPDHLYVTDNFIVTHNTSITNALHFSLFGKSIDNRINLPNLVNAINGKNCEVKLYFSKNDTQYIIHRGRAPVFLKFYVNGKEIVEKSQGNNRDTQKEIESVLGFTDEIYNQIFSLSPIVPGFLDQPLQKQRVIIENVLGVNQLTEKAELLKEKIKEHKQDIKNEQFIIDKLKATNNATIENYRIQKEKIQKEYNKWEEDKKSTINRLTNELSKLNLIDIEQEKNNFALLQEYNQIKEDNVRKKQEVEKICKEIQQCYSELTQATNNLNELNAIDIVEEERIYNENKQLKIEENEYKIKFQEYLANEKLLKDKQKNFMDNCQQIKKIDSDLENIVKNICPFCKQEMNKEESEKMIQQKNKEKKELEVLNHTIDMEILELNHTVNLFEKKEFKYQVSKYNDYESILHYKVNKDTVQKKIKELNIHLTELMTEAKSPEFIPTPEIEKPTMHYNSEGDIIKHNLLLEQYTNELHKIQSNELQNPFVLQLDNLSNPPLTEIDETKIIQCEKTLKHEEILLKLLNNPDSYIRKYIIDTNLQFLNERVRYYLEKMGSLHNVVFNNDMSVTITKMGIEYGYISTGEMSRASLALTLAFRDIWEQLNTSVNLFYIDEVLDRSGLDTAGVELMTSLLKDYTVKGEKNMFLVSHREELISSTDDIFTVVMENGFTNLEYN